MTATVSSSNATKQLVTWTSSNTTVATISTTGLVTCRAAGTATITVRTADGGRTATSVITVTTPTANINITARARGVVDSEQIRLRVATTMVATWTLTTAFVNRTVTTTATGDIMVEYFNDASGRDVQIDNIVVNGTTRQAESITSNTGVWQNNQCGGSCSEWLHCDGAIGFGDLITGRSAEVEMVEEGMYLITAPEEHNNQPGVLVFLIPVGNTLSIRLYGNHAGEVYVRIFNAKGALVRSIDTTALLTKLDVFSLNSGIYIVQVRSEGYLSNHRFLKE